MAHDIIDAAAGRFPDPASAALYAHALRAGQIAATVAEVAAEVGLPVAVVSAAVADLRRLRLLREERSGGGGRLVPVDPEVAAAALVSPIDEEVRERQLAISRIRSELSAFRPQYATLQRGRHDGAGIEEIHSREVLDGYLYLAAERCCQEFVASRPNHVTDDKVSQGELAMAKRGVRVRLLLQHAARADIRLRMDLDALLGQGIEIRTASELSRHVLVFDADLAFLLNDHGADGEPVGVVIRNPSAVRLLLDLIEAAWTSAEPCAGRRIGYHEVMEHLHGTIIRLLAEGLTDEAVARRLGISVRTCRRHIATVLRGLDAVTRFQAGVRVGAAGRGRSATG
ncbi:helix-turn-helix domain-containing protein [Nonomuraea sp. NPDC049695]|uniref:helix-turn-helix transcriptional regulator n=1 Tax=Nonomuraea sp. NPDC049695 TaxID=3154734 RepID=UPI003448D78F